MSRNCFSAIYALVLALATISCNRNGNLADAYGNFEAEETTIASEATGKLVVFNVEEGDKLLAGQLVGVVDSIQLHLRRKQLLAQISAVNTKIPNLNAQLAVQDEQLRVLGIEYDRLKKLFDDGAATQRQMDDIEGRIGIARKQKEAIEVQRMSVAAEVESIRTQVEQVDDQLKRCRVVNPLGGSVLVKYVQANEMVTQGRALYKLANLDYMFLRAYIDGTQLHAFPIGKIVKVIVDGESGQPLESEGTVTWVSSEAEFTPKIIQTREERVKLVYAMKGKVKNNGWYRIGMPGEVRIINN